MIAPNQANKGRGGFVLIAAIATLLIGSIWAASAAQRMIESARAAEMLEQSSRDRVAAQNGLAAAIFLLLTSPKSECGWQPRAEFVEDEFLTPGRDLDAPCLRLDGRLTRLVGAELEFQDAGGLLGVRSPREAFMVAFLATRAENNGVYDMTTSLIDLGDRDDITHPGGAESAQYELRDRPPPRNRWPRTPYEVFEALGWEDAAVPAIANLLGLGISRSINVNSAPAETLSAIAPFDTDMVQAVVSQRAIAAFVNDAALADATGGILPAQDFALAYISADVVRVRVGATDRGRIWEVSLSQAPVRPAQSLTPQDEPERAFAAPWRIDYLIPIPHLETPPVEGGAPSSEDDHWLGEGP